MPADLLPMTADPAGGSTPVLDIEAMLCQVEQEAEEREDFADLASCLASGDRHSPDK